MAHQGGGCTYLHSARAGPGNGDSPGIEGSRIHDVPHPHLRTSSQANRKARGWKANHNGWTAHYCTERKAP